jgi:hypothetical protein
MNSATAPLVIPSSQRLRQSILEFCRAWRGVDHKLGFALFETSAAEQEAERWASLACQWSARGFEPGVDARYAANLAGWWMLGRSNYDGRRDLGWKLFNWPVNPNDYEWSSRDKAKTLETVLDFCLATVEKPKIGNGELGLDIQRDLFARRPLLERELLLAGGGDGLDIEF